MKLSSRFRLAGSMPDIVVPVGAQYQEARGNTSGPARPRRPGSEGGRL